MVNDFETAAWKILDAILGKPGTTFIPAVNVEPHRTMILKYFILMNVPLRMDNHRWVDNIPVADFYVSPPKTLFPVRVDPADMPALQETLPILLKAAAHADGTSIIPNYQINGKNHA